MNCLEIAGGWVLLPARPLGIIHFIGGFFVGGAPQLAYQWLLNGLAQGGYSVIATPALASLDHRALARDTLNQFETILSRLQRRSLLSSSLPIYGLGHSLGCKLHLLLGSLYGVERLGNILISYNNYGFKQSIPFADSFNRLSNHFQARGFSTLTQSKEAEIEFTPSPQLTYRLIRQDYPTRRNLLIQFQQDTIDQTTILYSILHSRFSHLVTHKQLPGNHTTPLGGSLDWSGLSNWHPWLAWSEWALQETNQDLKQLRREIFSWLNPLGGF